MPGTLFYVDPPYGAPKRITARGPFSREDFTRLESLLAGLKGKFILSLNDTPSVLETFSEFRIAVKTRYSLAAKAKQL